MKTNQLNPTFSYYCENLLSSQKKHIIRKAKNICSLGNVSRETMVIERKHGISTITTTDKVNRNKISYPSFKDVIDRIENGF